MTPSSAALSRLLALLTPIEPFGLFLEGKMWFGPSYPVLGGPRRHLALVSDPGQVGPNRSDPGHYDEHGRYMWWGC